jgi:hypothetical protein
VSEKGENQGELRLRGNRRSNSIVLGQNKLYLIPFNQMRNATLAQMSVMVQSAGGTGAKMRLGIYKNNASNDNYPAGLLKDAGELDVTGAGYKTVSNIGQALSADNRYWAAVITNDANVSIRAYLRTSAIFWGMVNSTTFMTLTHVQLSQAYGALPDPAPVNAGTGDLFGILKVPAIFLGFSAVT